MSNVLDELENWLVDRIKESIELRYHDLERAERSKKARLFNGVLEKVREMKGRELYCANCGETLKTGKRYHLQCEECRGKEVQRKAVVGDLEEIVREKEWGREDEVAIAVNAALDSVEKDMSKWFSANAYHESYDLAIRAAIRGARPKAKKEEVSEWDSGRYVGRSKAKKEEEKVAGLDIVVDPTLPEGVIELRHNGKLMGKIVNVGEGKVPPPKFSKGQAVRVFGEVRALAEWEPVWSESGGGWDYLVKDVGWVNEKNLSPFCEEKRPEPKFKKGQHVRGKRSGIQSRISGEPVWAYNKNAFHEEMWEWVYPIVLWGDTVGEHDMEAVEEPTTHSVMDVWEIGTGKECGPCVEEV